jgi:hypothetical protein
MRIVRLKHICCNCKRYPGDTNYTFGTWKHGSYRCFECSPN